MRDFTVLALLLALPGWAHAQANAPRRFDVQVGGGLARIVITRDLTGPARQVARWDEPLPEGAGLAGVLVCRGEVCHRAAATERFGPLGFHAEAVQRDDRLSMVVGPLDPHTPLTLEIRLTAPTRFVAGMDGIRLPARPGDAVRLSVRGLDAPQIGGEPARGWMHVTPEMREDGMVQLAARASGTGLHIEALAARCGHHRCLRYRMWSPPVRGVARDVFVLEDVSGSTSQVPLSHRRRVTARLIEGLPDGSRVRRVAFAWRARTLDPGLTQRDALPEVTAPPFGLGAATRISSAWALIQDEVRQSRAPLVVVVGDGTLGWWATERDALVQMERAGAELSVLDLVGRHPTSTLSTAIRRTAGALLEASGERLPSALPYLAHPVVANSPRIGLEPLQPLRAGEERILERIAGTLPPALHTEHGLTRPRGIARPWENGLAVSLGERLGASDPRRRLRTRTQRPDPGVPRVIAGSCEIGGGSSRQMLGRLRDRWMPRVNACFQDARRRGDRAALRAHMEVIFQNGEVILTRSTGVPRPLAACLEDVPAYTEDIPLPEGSRYNSERYHANFQFVSQAVVRPATLPLREDVAALVDAL
ncbi:MAG: hypothetical protein AB8I08_34145 [Sandaracinaceae bacterium]